MGCGHPGIFAFIKAQPNSGPCRGTRLLPFRLVEHYLPPSPGMHRAHPGEGADSRHTRPGLRPADAERIPTDPSGDQGHRWNCPPEGSCPRRKLVLQPLGHLSKEGISQVCHQQSVSIAVPLASNVAILLDT